MKRILVTTVVAAAALLLAIASAGPAFAEDCKYYTFTSNETPMDEPLPGYDSCFSGKVRGNLTGQYTSCYRLLDFYFSHWLWLDGNYDILIGKGDIFIETSKGELSFEERGIYQVEGYLATGRAEVAGGTGKYDGATGVLFAANRWPNRLDLFKWQGRICTPSDD